MVIVSSFLLNSPIELFAFKFKNWSFKDNALRYIFILVSLFLIGTLKFLAIPAIILFYIVSSLVNTISVSQDKK
jgi:CDP-diacylglycerol--serine O-phosphatidyltransferase